MHDPENKVPLHWSVWRSIATHPKGEVWVLLYQPKLGVIPAVFDAYGTGDWWTMNTDPATRDKRPLMSIGCDHGEPTHWMPMPDKP